MFYDDDCDISNVNICNVMYNKRDSIHACLLLLAGAVLGSHLAIHVDVCHVCNDIVDLFRPGFGFQQADELFV